jgi:hypothetical protein
MLDVFKSLNKLIRFTIFNDANLIRADENAILAKYLVSDNYRMVHY